MIEQQREIPRNIEAEQALIGAVLLKNDSFIRVSAIVSEEHFFEEIHANVWSVIEALITKGQVANPVLLKTYLGNPEISPGRSMLAYLTDITMAASSNYATADSYARTVRDQALMRRIIEVGGQLQDVAYEAPVEMTAEILFAQAESKLEALRPSIQKDDNGFLDFDSISLASIYEAHQNQRGVVGLSTGLPKLDAQMNGLQDSDLIVLAGRPAMGKAQPMDARVLTLCGWKLMGQLQVGDRLASPDGRPSYVEGIYPQGERQIYRITLSDGRSTECCDEHLWRVHYREWDVPRVLQTAEIRRMLGVARYRGRLWIDEVTGDFGDDAGVTLDPWLLGALLGDGTLRGRLRFSTVESDVLAQVVSAAGPDMHATFAGHNTYRIVRRAGAHVAGMQGVSPNPIVEKLKALGVWGLDSSTKFIPAAYLNGSRETRLNLLRGLMDTDGWAEAHGSVRFSSISRALAEGVCDLVRSLGGTCSIVAKATTFTRDGVSAAGQQVFTCRIRHINAETFFRSERKAGRAVRGRNVTVRLTFKTIEPSRVAQAQCIKVSHPDSLYVTDDYVVTHNTALATGISVHVARGLQAELANGGRGGVVGFFSLEMSADQLKHRIVSDMASVQASKLAKGEASQDEMQAFVDAERDLRGLPLKIDKTGGLSIAQVKMRARALHKRHGLRLLVIDYLQLLSGSNSKGRDYNRTQEVTEITTGLKALAKELEIPIIALSQLARRVEERDDKRPMLQDLRESGSIEQDADVVLFVYRDEYYVRNQKPREEGERLAEWARKMDRIKGVAEINVAKNRHGGDGVVEVGWLGEFTRFTPDPPWRLADPEEARQKAKSVQLTKHGVAMRDILREMAVAMGTRPTPKQLGHKAWLPHNALLVVRNDVKEEMRTRILSDLNDGEFRKAMQAAADNLRHAGLTQVYKDEDDVIWIYLVEIIGE